MRWIDRGPEPDGVAQYARQYTPGWVDYFEKKVGDRPTDFLWSLFRPELGGISNNNCWYCERQCEAVGDLEPTIDHFRPLRHSPHLAYTWDNWIFSCRRCNSDNKQDQWPESGYVDPCAANPAERPERYFDYDANTGEVVPRDDISGVAKRKAQHTIADLGLNKLDVMYYRLQWTRQIVADLRRMPVSERQAFAEYITQPPAEYIGIARMVLAQEGFPAPQSDVYGNTSE